MSRITQVAYHRQRLIEYAKTHSVTETSIRFKCSRKTVYKWLNRYDGTIYSLLDRSHRPHWTIVKQIDTKIERIL